VILTIDNEWPATLPLPYLDYSGNPYNQTIYSPDGAFFIARRSRFTKSYCILSVAWNFDDDEFEAFKLFVLNSLGNATSQFKIELRFPKNTELTEWAVRFESGYQANQNDGVWNVIAALELVNPVNI
jgi:hypothetical protein